MIAVIEALETEELNPTERMLYRPVWNRMLPPLDRGPAERESISSSTGRYRLTFDPPGSGSVGSSIERATRNAESIQECLSNEAWRTLTALRTIFERSRKAERLTDAKRAALTRRAWRAGHRPGRAVFWRGADDHDRGRRMGGFARSASASSAR